LTELLRLCSFSPRFPLHPVPIPSCLFHFPFALSLPYRSNPARESGGASGWSPAAKRFWCIFRLKSAHLFHFHVTFVIFTIHLGCVQRQYNKIPVGRLRGHRPHNFLAVGAIAPMESAPMIQTVCWRSCLVQTRHHLLEFGEVW